MTLQMPSSGFRRRGEVSKLASLCVGGNDCRDGGRRSKTKPEKSAFTVSGFAAASTTSGDLAPDVDLTFRILPVM